MSRQRRTGVCQRPCDGELDCTDLVQREKSFYTLPLPESGGKAVVVLEWDRA